MQKLMSIDGALEEVEEPEGQSPTGVRREALADAALNTQT